MGRQCLLWATCLTILLVSCTPFKGTEENSRTDFAGSLTPTVIPSSTPTERATIAVIVATTPVPQKENEGLITPLPTPTPRFFQVPACGNTDDIGHIYYLVYNGKENGELHYASRFNLYMMSASGCHPRFLMEDVSGSPAWSKDGKLIAVGCENNSTLCVFDAQEVFNVCHTSLATAEPCLSAAVAIQRISLPVEVAGDKYLNNITWSYDGSKIVVEGKDEETRKYTILIHELDGHEVRWKKLAEEYGAFVVEGSPVKDYLVSSGVYRIGLIGANRERITEEGQAPVWSPDGKKIAFIKGSNDAGKEPAGIAVLDVETKKVTWLYEPVNRDKHYWPEQNLIVGHDSHYHKMLSWSPDGRYLTFISPLYGMYDSNIFRINVTTGEIDILTLNHSAGGADGRFFAPAWGP